MGASDEVPGSRLVTVGRIGGAFGVRGAVRVASFVEDPAWLLGFAEWWLDGGTGTAPRRVRGRLRAQGSGMVATLEGVTDRNAAQLLNGAALLLERDRFPPAAPDSYYWVDLIGCRVVTSAGVELGVVDHLIATGANDVMVVLPPGGTEADELLLPFIAQVVRQVDPERGVITVELLPGLL